MPDLRSRILEKRLSDVEAEVKVLQLQMLDIQNRASIDQRLDTSNTQKLSAIVSDQPET